MISCHHFRCRVNVDSRWCTYLFMLFHIKLAPSQIPKASTIGSSRLSFLAISARSRLFFSRTVGTFSFSQYLSLLHFRQKFKDLAVFFSLFSFIRGTSSSLSYFSAFWDLLPQSQSSAFLPSMNDSLSSKNSSRDSRDGTRESA